MKVKTIEKLKKWGLSELQITKILNHHAILTTKDETLLKNIEDVYSYFLEKNFLPSQIIKMFCKSPEIFCFTKQNLINKETNLQKNGYTQDEINKLLKNNPKIVNYSIKTLNQKIEEIIRLGFTKKQVLKMALKAATLLELDVENNLKKKITDMEKLGFSYNEVIKIAVRYPELFSHNIFSIAEKIENIQSLGFTEDEVKYIINCFPTIIGLSFQNIKEKVNYIKEIGIFESILLNPTNLMQSVSVIYARNEFFKNNNITFDTKLKYISYIFCSSTLFEQKFKISKNLLLSKYNYKEYCEGKENGKFI